jgi:hypothetical protein
MAFHSIEIARSFPQLLCSRDPHSTRLHVPQTLDTSPRLTDITPQILYFFTTHLRNAWSIAQYIPAVLLFSQKDVQHFVEWRKEHRPNHLPGQIQDFIEYCEFLEYQRGNVAIAKFERSRARARRKNSAIKCGHGLHLSDIILTGYCPVCEVDMCLTFLDVSRSAAVRGRKRKPEGSISW